MKMVIRKVSDGNLTRFGSYNRGYEMLYANNAGEINTQILRRWDEVRAYVTGIQVGLSNPGCLEVTNLTGFILTKEDYDKKYPKRKKVTASQKNVVQSAGEGSPVVTRTPTPENSV